MRPSLLDFVVKMILISVGFALCYFGLKTTAGNLFASICLIIDCTLVILCVSIRVVIHLLDLYKQQRSKRDE